MKIAHLTCVFPPYPGGIGRVAYEIAKRQSGRHEVEIFTPYYKGIDNLPINGFKINYLKGSYQVGKASLIPDILQKLSGFDVVHLHYPWFGVHEFLNKLDKKIKLVVTYHMSAKSVGLKQLAFSLDEWLYARSIAKRADVLLTATEDYYKHVALPKFGQAPKWQILPFGVDESYAPLAKRIDLLVKLGFSEQDKLLIFVGTLDKAHEFKGLPVLLRALTKINDPKLKLLVVGQGDMKESYINLAKILGVNQNVKFVGYVSDKELPDFYRLAQVMVFPSTSTAEAFGLVALQAMACGLPVIASDLPGVRELVKNEVAGLTVPPNNVDELAVKIVKLVNDSDLMNKLGQQGRTEVLEKYQWNDIVEKLENIYKTVLAK